MNERMKFGNPAEGSVDAYGQFAREVAARLEAGKKFREEAAKAETSIQTAENELPPEALAAK